MAIRRGGAHQGTDRSDRVISSRSVIGTSHLDQSLGPSNSTLEAPSWRSKVVERGEETQESGERGDQVEELSRNEKWDS